MRKSTPVGAVLKALREEAGLTQSALAERAGLAASHLSQLEASRRGDPQWGTITAIAVALGVSLDEIGRRCGLPFTGTTKAESGALAAKVAAEVATTQRHLEQATRAQDRVAKLVASKGGQAKR